MRQANVLLVDNDPPVRLELKTHLVALGHRVVGEAENGNQAITLARNLRPDVVLLDLTLPSLSGLDIAQTLLAERIAAIVILADSNDTDGTNEGTADKETLDKLEELGINGFLSKPLRLIDLRVIVPLAIARFQERIALEDEIKSLNERMEARKLVGRAKAILMERHGLSERDAFKRIQSQSIALGKQAHEIAQAIITASEITMGGGAAPTGTGAASNPSAITTPPASNSGDVRPLPVRQIRGEKAALDAVQP